MRTFLKPTALLALLLLAVLPVVPAHAGRDGGSYDRWGWGGHGDSRNLIETLERQGNYGTLLSLLDATGLTSTVESAEALTIYAPTDDAFADVPAETLAFLGENPDVLTDVLTYHVTPGKKRIGRLLLDGTADTLLGQPVLITFEAFRIFINDAPVVRANLRASNGFIHGIDAVLLPPEDPISIESTMDVLKLDGRFETLIFALEATGLDEAVRDNELTIFAPTDDAFANLPDGALDALVADPAALTDVLLYHVVPGNKGAIFLLLEGTVETLQGEDVRIRFRRGAVRVNNARVITPNVESPTGQFHAIDAVLLPPAPPMP